MDALPMLGKVTSHGYISCGFLPVHISFPFLSSVLLSLIISEKFTQKLAR